MDKKEAKAPVPFSVMSGDGEPFIVKDKKYTILSMEIGDAIHFSEDKMSIGKPLFNLVDEESRKKTDKYLLDYCIDDKGEAVSLEKAISEKWTLQDLRRFFEKLCELSG